MIREARLDDLVDFLRLGRQFAALAGEPFDRESLVQHVEWIIEGENTVAFVFDDEQVGIIGIVAGIYFPTFWDSEHISASELWWFVDSEFREAGVGTALMDALESWAMDRGANRLSMMLIADIAPGVEKIYEKKGYTLREQTYLKEF